MTSTPETSPLESAGLALVTGASSGIGRALAANLVRRGYDVVVAAEDDAVRDTATALTEESGRQVVAVQVDLAQAAQVQSLYDEVQALGRPVDVLCLNAGIGVGGRFLENDLDADLRLVDLNVRSVVHLSKLVLRDMARRGEGRVLVTSSIAAIAPTPFQATYAASKAFDHFLAEGLRAELKESGVTVTSLMPGPTDTEFFDRAGLQDSPMGQGPKDDPEQVAEHGLAALFAGKDSVVAGSWSNWVQAQAASHLPDKVAAMVSGRMSKPASD